MKKQKKKINEKRILWQVQFSFIIISRIVSFRKKGNGGLYRERRMFVYANLSSVKRDYQTMWKETLKRSRSVKM